MMDNINKKSVLVLGLGKSGKQAALLLKQRGAGVTILEQEKNFSTLKKKQELEKKGIEVVFGSQDSGLLHGKDMVVVSPSIPSHFPIVKHAQKIHLPVISELELASRFIPKKNIIAVTGTNGKTTTTFLIYKILKKNGILTEAGGNIGNPLSRIARIYSSKSPLPQIITEVSSFQLEKCETFSPRIYCILNISADHLDRHFSFINYRRIKATPLSRMSGDDFVVLNYDQSEVRTLSKLTSAKVIFFSKKQRLNQGFFLEGDCIVANLEEKSFRIPVGDIQIENFHNLENVLCSVAVALIEGVSTRVITDSLASHKPLPHRQEYAGKVGGVEFIDDSKATNTAAVENMLTSLTRSAVLIMGGKDKNDDFSSLKKYFPGKIKSIVLIGEAKKRIKRQLGTAVPSRECESLPQAVKLAFSLSERGDSVVLCPGCSSLDQFTNYKHRGRVFKQQVERLRGKDEERKFV